MFKKILVAYDGSDGAVRALAVALELAKPAGTNLHLVAVEEISRFPASIDEVVEETDAAKHRLGKAVQRARAKAKIQGIALGVHLVAGHPVPAIASFIEQLGIDLLIVGFMGHSALYNRLIGSTTDRLVELAQCTVLVVK